MTVLGSSMQQRGELIDALWDHAVHAVTNPTGDTDFPRKYDLDEIKMVFASLVARRCVHHVDKWTGTKFTPATDIIKQDIQNDFM